MIIGLKVSWTDDDRVIRTTFGKTVWHYVLDGKSYFRVKRKNDYLQLPIEQLDNVTIAVIDEGGI